MQDLQLAAELSAADPILQAVRARFRVRKNPARNKKRRFMRATQADGRIVNSRIPRNTGQYPKFAKDRKHKQHAHPRDRFGAFTLTGKPLAFGEQVRRKWFDGEPVHVLHPLYSKPANEPKDVVAWTKHIGAEALRNMTPKQRKAFVDNDAKQATLTGGMSKILFLINECAPSADPTTAASPKPESTLARSSAAASAWHRFAPARSSRVSSRTAGCNFLSLYRKAAAAKRRLSETPAAASPR